MNRKPLVLAGAQHAATHKLNALCNSPFAGLPGADACRYARAFLIAQERLEREELDVGRAAAGLDVPATSCAHRHEPWGYVVLLASSADSWEIGGRTRERELVLIEGQLLKRLRGGHE